MLTITPINSVNFSANSRAKCPKAESDIPSDIKENNIAAMDMATAKGVSAIAGQKVNKKLADLREIEQDRQVMLDNAEEVKFMFLEEHNTAKEVARRAETLLSNLEKEVLLDHRSAIPDVMNKNNRVFTEESYKLGSHYTKEYDVEQYDDNGELLYEMHFENNELLTLTEYIPGTDKKNEYTYAWSGGRVRLVAKLDVDKNTEEVEGPRYDFLSIEAKNQNLKIDDSQFRFIHHLDNNHGLKWGQQSKDLITKRGFIEAERSSDGSVYKYDKDFNLTQIRGPYNINNIPWTSIAKRVDFDENGNITRYNTGIEYDGRNGYQDVNNPHDKQSDEHYLKYFKVDKAYQLVNGKLEPQDKLDFAKQLFQEMW